MTVNEKWRWPNENSIAFRCCFRTLSENTCKVFKMYPSTQLKLFFKNKNAVSQSAVKPELPNQSYLKSYLKTVKDAATCLTLTFLPIKFLFFSPFV